MDSIFKGSAAPYALVFLVSVLGWLFNSAIENAKSVRFVEYALERPAAEGPGVAVLTLRNRSLGGAVEGGSFLVSCIAAKGDSTPCFRNLPGSSRKAEYLRSGSVVLASVPEEQAGSLVLSARIPARGTAAYRIGLSDPAARIVVQYDLKSVAASAGAGVDLVLVEGWSLEGFVMANYLKILIFGIMALAALFFFYIVLEFLRLFARKPPAPPPAEGVTLSLTTPEGEYNAKVERR